MRFVQPLIVCAALLALGSAVDAKTRAKTSINELLRD